MAERHLFFDFLEYGINRISQHWKTLCFTREPVVTYILYKFTTLVNQND